MHIFGGYKLKRHSLCDID